MTISATDPAPPPAPSRRLTAAMALLDRHPWLLPLASFLAGWASYWLVERGPALARLVALMALLSWPWMLMENALGERLHRWSRGRLSPRLAMLVTQSVQQEMLFFVLPFALGALSLTPGHLLFGGLLVAAALFSTLDPLYHRGLSRNPALSVAFQSYCSFVTALVVLPVALHWPVERAVDAAAAIAALALLAGLPRVWSAGHRPPAFAVLALTASLLLLCLPLRSGIPPVGLKLSESRISQSIEDLKPGEALRRIDRRSLGEQGLVAYVAVHAPAGLSQTLHFDWYQDGRRIDRIPARIEGAPGRGWRTYTRKRHFPEDPRGRWRVELRTPGDQLIGRLRFEVVD